MKVQKSYQVVVVLRDGLSISESSRFRCDAIRKAKRFFQSPYVKSVLVTLNVVEFVLELNK